MWDQSKEKSTLIEMSSADTSLFASSILGYRCWNADDEGRLYAIWKDELWQPGVNHAQCRRGSDKKEHAPPGKDCGCGLNAYHAYARASFIRSIKYTSGLGVVGAVAGRGRVQIHHTGWRAEQAQILGIVGPSTYQLELVADRYSVPILENKEALIEHASGLAKVAGASLIPPADEETLKEQEQLREIQRALDNAIGILDSLLRINRKNQK